MRNYIILNGHNSNEITGLLIQTLPPISQPKIRTNIEEIDGRDGDIITKLGYSAYNKEISIGLYGNYNVDDIIQYFTDNQSGKVTFSDEPDKYYYYEILDQIDFDKLIRYRTATVTLHCQPFKYSTTEEKIQIDATEVSGSGSNITLDNTEDGALFTSLQINGDTLQDGTPTPSAPINVDVVTGDNNIVVCGKNLLDMQDGTYVIAGITAIVNNGAITLNGTASGTSFIHVPLNSNISINGSFTISANNNFTLGTISNWAGIRLGNIDYDTIGGQSVFSRTNTSETFNVENKVAYYLTIRTASGLSYNNNVIYPQVEKGLSATSYEPYVSQTYPVNLGKNLFDESKAQIGKAWNNTSNTARAIVLTRVQPNTKYTISFNSLSGLDGIYLFDRVNENDSTYITGNTQITQTTTITTASTCNWLGIQFNKANITQEDINNVKVQIELGSTASSYSPYFEPIELCKIGEYQDYIYKENGNWYKYNAIGKVVLDGSENWLYGGITSIFYTTSITDYAINNNIPYSNYYKGVSNVTGASNMGTQNNNTIGFINQSGETTPRFYIKDTTYTGTNVNDLINWLSTHNTIVYYQLATPTTTQITDTTLLSQLEALAGATTYLGQTNIITSGSTLNPLLEVTTFAVDDPSFVITNSGNINSKPIITIYGLGTIGLYLNGIQVLSLDMGETTSQITIDVAKMEAYNQETGALMNRSVTGDYNNLSLNVGENTITESGTLQGLEVENYSRWL